MGELPDRAPPAPAFTGVDQAAENRLFRLIIEVTSSDLDVREVSQRVAALVTEATGADVCFVHLVDEERERVVLAGATPPFDELVGSVELALGEGIAGWVAKNARPTVVPNKWNDRRYRYIPSLRGEDYASMVSVPMLVRPPSARVVGVLNVHTKEAREWNDRDVALLSDVANLLARTIENARLYASLAQREEVLETFAARTVEAQELERRRLAAEIHDGISQRLVSLWYHLLAAEDAVGDPARVSKELAVAKELARAALSDARSAITGLRPSVLDDLGLGPSLESLARSLPGVETEVEIAPDRLPAHVLPPHVEVALYRIAQEAVQNVLKHSNATHLTLVFGPSEEGARLVVADDGTGLPEDWMAAAEEGHSYGMVGMRERAELIGARLTVTSHPGRGTSVEVVVPAPPVH
ncbi:MAG: GAF domain-containing protein [Acidimicrobiales bacterium]|nr:sensor histidine kinase [Actinomycetota bacterium]